MTFNFTLAFAFLLLLLVHPAPALHFTPEQIHLAFGQTPDYVAVQWSTRSLEDLTSVHSDPSQQPRSLVAYGLDPTHLDREAEGLSVVFVDSGPHKRRQLHHVVNMTGLAASTRYWYRVGDASLGGLSPVYSFKTAPDAATLPAELPLRLAVWGDMGVDKNGSTVLRHMLKHVHRDADVFDAIGKSKKQTFPHINTQPLTHPHTNQCMLAILRTTWTSWTACAVTCSCGRLSPWQRECRT